ncbi:hypothetical protein M409DRAFT_24445 [Zasmidium cellare ATCC 36951]|uniref:DUF7730 domain-containing protein n=1 Tax=Zasmidium cellare ATCC 36951 TaxID=1080233 RepID=A0A6A6CH96_ZASCE|nr:uncharacterized protein M409DRAFT_24445 [Zasmidium cellare ATCC 36951]KAF2165059.1 hypothetical protein M409DRAFT_24445 [Zasmidium cellare ATCC 36951]
MEPIDVVVENYDQHYEATAKGLLLSSKSLLGSAVPYSEKYDCHVRTIAIGKDTSYHIKPVGGARHHRQQQYSVQYTITEGPMKGFQALVLVPSGFFRLLDLPTEVRDMIYETVGAEGTTKLKLYRRKAPGGSKVVGAEYELRSKTWKEKRKWDEELKKWIDKERRTALSLLQVSKQVYNEAFKVLYRSRRFRFSFECDGTLSRFFELNEKCAQHITHIVLRSSSNNQRSMEALAKARPKSLQRLEIDHWAFLDTITEPMEKQVALLFKTFTQLFDAVYLARQRKGITAGIDELLRVRHRHCPPDAKCQEFDEQLPKLIKEEYPMSTGRGEKGGCGTE